ncbi:MAG: MBOAT family O-acyltransferase [Sulfurifustis sp.]
MLFSSLTFVLGFLPLALAIVLLGRRLYGPAGARLALAAVSLVFYGSWGWKVLPVLVLSAAVNYGISLSLHRAASTARRRGLILGIAANIVALGVFKYNNFFIDNWNALTGSAVPFAEIAFPIGISFFTLQQISYLLAVAADMEPPRKFTDYVLFVSCFAYVTAGPIVAAREFFSQREQIGTLTTERFVVAVTVFAVGLLKKVWIAESFAPYADQVFEQAHGGGAVGLWDAWLGAWSYSLQLYFDFSGYSEMALGLGLLFGLRLPLNFNSPLRATSAIEFWQRWHMTLTRFLTNNLFLPLSVKQVRRAATRKTGRVASFVRAYAIPVFVTFVLAGLWHGAAWTFVLFGAWWGVALAINHGWRQARPARLPVWLAWVLTMMTISIGMVLFRAPDLRTSGALLYAMFDLAHVEFVSQVMAPKFLVLMLSITAACLIAPNTAQIMSSWNITFEPVPKGNTNRLLDWRWRLDARGVAFTALVIIAVVLAGEQTAPFLYYQF